MALTLTRWIALALAGFALVPLIVLRERDASEYVGSERDRLRVRASLAASHVERAAERLRTLQLHDSVRRSLSRAPSATAGAHIDAAFDPDTRAAVVSLARDASAWRAPDPKLPVEIAVVLDSGRLVRGQSRSGFGGTMTVDYLLPTAGGDDRCTVIARVKPIAGPTPLRRNGAAELNSDVARQRLLGPCAFYEHFGQPGAQIDRWLRTRGWSLGQLGTWQGESPTWTLPSYSDSIRRRIDLHELMAPTGVACANDDDDACLAGLLGTGAGRRRSPMSLGNVTTANYNPFLQGSEPWYSRSWNFGALEWTMLADMVRTVGPDRFGQFWQSELAPAAAFQTATGEPLPRWTRDWVRRTYHAQTNGPTLPRASLLSGALLAILGVALSVRAARRRQLA